MEARRVIFGVPFGENPQQVNQPRDQGRQRRNGRNRNND